MRARASGLEVEKRRVSIYVNELEMVSRDRTSARVYTDVKTKLKRTLARKEQHVVLFINAKDDVYSFYTVHCRIIANENQHNAQVIHVFSQSVAPTCFGRA